MSESQSSSKKLSGASNRKRKAERDSEMKKASGSLMKFLSRPVPIEAVACCHKM